MKILLINGSPHDTGATRRALDECRFKLEELSAEVEYYHLGNGPRHACTACGGCKKRGTCVYGDIDYLTEKVSNADGIIIGTPTHYAGAPGNLLSVISRLLFSAKRCVEYKPIAVVGAGRRGCISSAIDGVAKFFSFTSAPTVSGIYPPIIYGTDYESAGYDAEGLQNMRSVSENIYWLTACILKARALGITPPIAEPRIKTDISSLL